MELLSESEILKCWSGVRYHKKEHDHVISKKEKRQNSKVPKFDLVRNVKDISLNFALRVVPKNLHGHYVRALKILVTQYHTKKLD